MRNETISVYIGVMHLPVPYMYSVFPNLEDPKDELQYQLLKLEYAILQAAQEIRGTIETMVDALKPSIEALAEDFRELSNKLFYNEISPDDVLYEQMEELRQHRCNNVISDYHYMRDKRKEARMYVRNHRY
jgi:hypothetical protein